MILCSQCNNRGYLFINYPVETCFAMIPCSKCRNMNAYLEAVGNMQRAINVAVTPVATPLPEPTKSNVIPFPTHRIKRKPSGGGSHA
jgi:hypothetical protein